MVGLVRRVVVTLVVAAPPDRVWRALTVPVRGPGLGRRDAL